MLSNTPIFIYLFMIMIIAIIIISIAVTSFLKPYNGAKYYIKCLICSLN